MCVWERDRNASVDCNDDHIFTMATHRLPTFVCEWLLNTSEFQLCEKHQFFLTSLFSSSLLYLWT